MPFAAPAASATDPRAGGSSAAANKSAASALRERLSATAEPAPAAAAAAAPAAAAPAAAPAAVPAAEHGAAAEKPKEPASEKLERLDDDNDGDGDGDSAVIVEAEGEEEIKQSKQSLAARVKEATQQQLDADRKKAMDNDVVQLGVAGWKTRYYTDKYKADDIAEGGGREEVFKAYVEGLCWVMLYYYRGVASWTWYYPFHYAPFASDLVNIDRFEISFDLGEPFEPVVQLLGVLPAQSAHAVPKGCAWLMTSEESPVLDFYPKKIECDPNGKPMPWLWVVLLPFIDEERLLAAWADVKRTMTPEELAQNERGQCTLFVHAAADEVNNLPACAVVDEKLTEFTMAEQGFAATLTPTSAHVDQGALVKALPKPTGALSDVKCNQVVAVSCELPEGAQFQCKLLDGAVELPPRLNAADLHPGNKRSMFDRRDHQSRNAHGQNQARAGPSWGSDAPGAGSNSRTIKVVRGPTPGAYPTSPQGASTPELTQNLL